MSIGKAERSTHEPNEVTPGPLAYKPWFEVQRKRAPTVTIGSAKREDSAEKTATFPGPASYETEKNAVKGRSTSYSFYKSKKIWAALWGMDSGPGP